jgi:hypothetical protein
MYNLFNLEKKAQQLWRVVVDVSFFMVLAFTFQFDWKKEVNEMEMPSGSKTTKFRFCTDALLSVGE